ncbi:MAG: hypothetical protein GY781_08515 [Gammaproteobacteria bacterium]|nr:hypothetical protein [Gammaproteobacteria bacterium]
MYKHIHKTLLDKSKNKYPNIYNLIVHNGLIETNQYNHEEFFEFMARTVVSQQLSDAAANTIWGRIKSLAEDEKCLIIDLFCPENSIPVKGCGISGNKFRAISELRSALKKKLICPKTIISSIYEEVISKITSLWGFGLWSADMCAIFYCNLPDIYPENDVAIIRGIEKLCLEDVNHKTVAQDFSPYRSYLCHHIWMGVDSGII